MDSRARPSNTGVRASASPYAPMCGLMSSFEIQTMLGRAGGAGAVCPAAGPAIAAIIKSEASDRRAYMVIIVSLHRRIDTGWKIGGARAVGPPQVLRIAGIGRQRNVHPAGLPQRPEQIGVEPRDDVAVRWIANQIARLEWIGLQIVQLVGVP